MSQFSMPKPNHYTIPEDFFTSDTFGTLAGAAGAVYLICGTLQKAFNFNPRWLALLLSLLISFARTYMEQSQSDNLFKGLVTAMLNGFLIYATATGTNQLTASVPNKKYRPKYTQKQPQPKRQFTSSWWPD